MGLPMIDEARIATGRSFTVMHDQPAKQKVATSQSTRAPHRKVLAQKQKLEQCHNLGAKEEPHPHDDSERGLPTTCECGHVCVCVCECLCVCVCVCVCVCLCVLMCWVDATMHCFIDAFVDSPIRPMPRFILRFINVSNASDVVVSLSSSGTFQFVVQLLC